MRKSYLYKDEMRGSTLALNTENQDLEIRILLKGLFNLSSQKEQASPMLVSRKESTR